MYEEKIRYRNQLRISSSVRGQSGTKYETASRREAIWARH